MKRVILSFVLVGFSAPAFCQDLPEQNPPALPIAPVVLPPEVPQRPPLIAVPTTESTPPSELQVQKESLAWRAKAHKLRLSNTAQQQTLSTNYDAAIMSVIGSLSQAGLRVQTLNSKAGELLAVPIDARSKQKYVFVVAEMPPGTVTIKATSWFATKASSAVIDGVLQSLRSPR